ncbi:MAG: sigma-70 family RNA polymerase sigma factor [Victivallales bacterium]|nr:sigma-70 family RNA polymerase sigma factor [Victivallales bacterium]
MAYTTKIDLLRGVHNGDEGSWRQFWDFYTPFIMFCGNMYNLTHEELQDLRQEVMIAVMKSDLTGKYNPSVGRFRTYFQRIIRNQATNILRRRLSAQKGTARLKGDISVSDARQAEIQEEYDKLIIQAALDELREELDLPQFMAFEMYVIQGRAPADVACALNLSVNQVYLAKSRILPRFKAIFARLNGESD